MRGENKIEKIINRFWNCFYIINRNWIATINSSGFNMA